MGTYSDIHLADDLNHALAAGMSENTTESQHLRAIAILTAETPQSASHATAIANAIALLNRSLLHVRDPHAH